MTHIPGISIETLLFNFNSALDSVRSKVNDKFPRHEWYRSLVDAFRACLGDEDDQQTSVIWFALRFLDILWSILFGKMAGPSPWRIILYQISRLNRNGISDRTINLNHLKTSVEHDEDAIENIIRQAVGEYSPMMVPVVDISPRNQRIHAERSQAESCLRELGENDTTLGYESASNNTAQGRDHECRFERVDWEWETDRSSQVSD
ncbi:uncharacterized protein F4807DRAFT_472809 [Annulohypoxylon truncatum]|uniref:uncharacterized protein n=1 Tax=Annulohypoxylon truncatum TaxID=327061 RepID=UPI0020079E87|nr:uncharacterized protein F4807DRAFT_472809 [Annulohypoxylon truncatum]KAI1211971.1 hypothetical protein F4807DRAFT_472809 [Annulohypoxylon truncatum]